jgi:hypothetical protein
MDTLDIKNICHFCIDIISRFTFGNKHGGLSCFIEYLHRKLLILPVVSLIILKVLKKGAFIELHIKTINFLFYKYEKNESKREAVYEKRKLTQTRLYKYNLFEN